VNGLAGVVDRQEESLHLAQQGEGQRAERVGHSGRLAANRARRLHDAGIAPSKLA
jgi:hypothetical protein